MALPSRRSDRQRARFALSAQLAQALLLLMLLMLGAECRRWPTTSPEPTDRAPRRAAPSPAREAESDDARPSPASPEGFPSDVPLYPGAIALARRQTVTQLTMIFTTEDGLPHVLAFYRERLRREGWTVREQETLEGAPILDGRKDSRTCRVELTEDHARTYITVALSSQSGVMKE